MKIIQITKYVFIWFTDKEGDEIDIDNESSYKAFNKSNSKNMKIYCELEKKVEKRSDGVFIHKTVSCDYCKIFPIVGNRYKCLQCSNYDLCGVCEVNQRHDKHVIVKYTETQDPRNIIVLLNNGDQSSDIHVTTRCDGCSIKPIIGFRYKCIECHNYDLCSECQTKNVHSQHIFIRVPVRTNITNTKF